MNFDPESLRTENRAHWEKSAPGWGGQRDNMQRQTEPVTAWLLDARDLRAGLTVLELAAGPGDVGLAVAERVRPGGRVLATDGSEGMVEVLRARAAEPGPADTRGPRVMAAEFPCDREAASIDAAVCRWGFMLMADPAAAL